MSGKRTKEKPPPRGGTRPATHSNREIPPPPNWINGAHAIAMTFYIQLAYLRWTSGKRRRNFLRFPVLAPFAILTAGGPRLSAGENVSRHVTHLSHFDFSNFCFVIGKFSTWEVKCVIFTHNQMRRNDTYLRFRAVQGRM